MELLLNLLWLFISVVLFGTWCCWNLIRRTHRVGIARLAFEALLIACIAPLWVREDRSSLLSAVVQADQGFSGHAGHGLTVFLLVLCLVGGCLVHEKRSHPRLLEAQDIPVLPFAANARPLRAPPCLFALHRS
jgi:hypothetical protein